MSAMDSWDAEDFEVKLSSGPAVTGKWEGEDEDDDVKDNWDDEEEEEEEEDNRETPPGPAVGKKKKKIADIIAEKEAKRLQELEERKKEKEEQENKNLPEEKLEEKLRLQRIQEDSDMKLAAELVGDGEQKSIDSLDLSTKESLDEFRMALIEKIRSVDRLEKRPMYTVFVEDLCKGLCQNMESEDVKRVTSVLNALYNEKVKAAKQKSGKKKGSGKAKLNLGQGVIADDIAYNDYALDEYEDFI